MYYGIPKGFFQGVNSMIQQITLIQKCLPEALCKTRKCDPSKVFYHCSL